MKIICYILLSLSVQGLGGGRTLCDTTYYNIDIIMWRCSAGRGLVRSIVHRLRVVVPSANIFVGRSTRDRAMCQRTAFHNSRIARIIIGIAASNLS